MAPPKVAPKVEEKEEKEESHYATQEVNKGDSAHIKRLLDEVAAEVVLESGYDEDHFVSNVKIVLGLITCILALVAHFYPEPFPANKDVVMLCVGGYFLTNTLLQVFVMIWEKEVIVFTQPKDNAPHGLTLSTNLPRFSDMYQITIATANNAKEQDPADQIVVEKSVTAWFHDDGYLAEEIFRKDVRNALKKYESMEAKKRK